MIRLKSFNDIVFESNRFQEFKEILSNLEDLCLDFKDEGFEIIFGIMSQHTIHSPDHASFDENLDDIQIKMSSIGKMITYIKLDLKNLKDQTFSGKLNDEELQILISTITSIYSYLKSEGLVITGLWSKTIIGRKRYEFIRFSELSEIINHIKNCNLSLEDYIIDVRIAFMGQSIS